MILYMDASSLVKRYVVEIGSDEVSQVMAQARLVGTAVITRAEVSAALARAVRVGVLTEEEARAALDMFRSEWSNLVRVQITERVTARADDLAWKHGLRGYNAVHLAAATIWQDAMGTTVTFSTFDRQLWIAAKQAGLMPHPANLPALLKPR